MILPKRDRAFGGILVKFINKFLIRMALGNLPVPGRPTIWMIVGQEPTALAVGADGGCLDIFTLI